MFLTKQNILKSVIFLILLTILFPPFHKAGAQGLIRNEGYSFIFLPPDQVSIVSKEMLLTQWLGIFLLASTLWVLMEVGKAHKYKHYIGSEYLILIAEGEAQKLTFAQQYENGDISLIEFEQQRNSIDEQIRLHIEKRVEALLNSSILGRLL